MKKTRNNPERPSSHREREREASRFRAWTEKPMEYLAWVWLGLVVLEFAHGTNAFLRGVGMLIWGIFLVEFAVGFTLAPDKLRFLRRHWLNAISLAAPALRILRIARFARMARLARVARGARLVRVVGSVNRAMNALTRTMRKRGFGYVVVLSVLVTFVGAAGMYAFEKDAPGGGFPSYTSALWWTAMMLTTIGSEYWPKTAEGRLLCLILAIYSFAVFGYIAATLTSFFVDSDKGEDHSRKILEELRAIREEMARLEEARSKG